MSRERHVTGVILALAIVGNAPAAVAAEYAVSRGSEVRFTAKITGGTFVAHSSAVRGTAELDEQQGRVSSAVIDVRAGSFDTGVSLRNDHMRHRYLEAKRYPRIRFRVENAQVPTEPGSQGSVRGTFEIRGHLKQVPIRLRILSHTPTSILVEAKFKIRVTDYGIDQPRFAVVSMDPVINVTARILFARR